MSDNPKVFIKLCALDDSELTHTIENAILSAKHPNRLVFGISLVYKNPVARIELEHYLAKYKNYCTFRVEINTFSKDRLGVGKNRHIVNEMYEDEDYVLQIDAHTWFSKNWDETLINMINLHHDKTILTGLLPPYEPQGRQPIGKGVYIAKIVEERTYCEWMPNWNPMVFECDCCFFYPNKFCADFAFGTKEFGKYTGLEPKSFFWSEEPIQDYNLRKNGFTTLTPNIDYPLLCHLYSEEIHGEHGKRASVGSYLSEKETEYMLNVYDRKIYEDFFSKHPEHSQFS